MEFGSTRRTTSVRIGAVLLALGALTLLFGLVLGVVTGPSAIADALPGGLGPCLGSECPTEPPPLGNGAINGRDANINIFAGGDFTVVGGAAEAEGRVVVMGDFSQEKDPPSIYNVGAVGVGAQVPPPEGSTFLAVRGNTDVDDGQTLSAVKPEPNGAEGDIRGVSRSGDGIIEAEEAVFGPDQAVETDPFVGLDAELADASDCYAFPESGVDRPATGTVTRQASTWTFAGDGTSSLQVFTMTSDLVGEGVDPAGVAFTGIPDGATVLVNVVPSGSTWAVNASFDAGGWESNATHLLWNIPDAVTVELGGPVQWYGSVLVGQPASTATVTVPGLNGRFFATGDVVHGSPSLASAGQEFHWYPFDGDLPSCPTVPTTTASTTTTTTTSATTTTIPPTTTDPGTTTTSVSPAIVTRPPEVGAGGAGLAFTGSPTVEIVGVGALLVLGGFVFVRLGRTNRPN